MSLTAETHVSSTPPLPEVNLTTPSDRRADIDAKQTRVATLLQETQCEGLLLLDPENVAWMTSGASSRGILDPADTPVVFISSEGRWMLSSNVDSQRLFDEELDGLGFQLKEWPWHRAAPSGWPTCARAAASLAISRSTSASR